MSEKLKTDWRVDGDDVVLTIELRMGSDWFFARAREIYQVINPVGRALSEHLLEEGKRSVKNFTRLSADTDSENG